MAKIEKMFGAILKDQEQKSDELRDKIHAENKLKKEEAEKSSERPFSTPEQQDGGIEPPPVLSSRFFRFLNLP